MIPTERETALVSARKRLAAVENAWFTYAFEDAAALTPDEHIEAAETFARLVGDAVFGGVPHDTVITVDNVCAACDGGFMMPDTNGVRVCNQCGEMPS